MSECMPEPSYYIWSEEFGRNITNPEYIVWMGCDNASKSQENRTLEDVGQIDLEGWVAPGSTDKGGEGLGLMPLIIIIGALVTALVLVITRQRKPPSVGKHTRRLTLVEPLD